MREFVALCDDVILYLNFNKIKEIPSTWVCLWGAHISAKLLLTIATIFWNNKSEEKERVREKERKKQHEKNVTKLVS